MTARILIASLAALFVSGFIAPQIVAETPATTPTETAVEKIDCCATQPASATQPAGTTPATLPAARTKGFSLRGQVKIDAGWTLQPPDLSRIVVYLASAPTLDAVPSPQASATMSQQNKSFVPNFLVVSRGTSIEFPNWDHFYHNVFSRSAAAPAFDLSRYPYGQSKTRVFTKIGAVQVFCNIHPDMRALIFVTPNPFFAHAENDGHFEIKDVPAGKYELVVWNERCSELRQPVEITTGDVADLAFVLQESRDAGMASEAPRRASSYGVERGLSIKREPLNLPVVEGAHPAPTPPPDATPSRP